MVFASGHHPSIPPIPPDVANMQRVNETRRRRRMLGGAWGPDLERRLRDHFGPVRRGIIGPKSLAKNSFRKLCNELGVNYDESPSGSHRTLGDVPAMFGQDGLLHIVGLWPMMRRVQVLLIGLREMLLRPDWSEELGQPILRLVYPDMVLAFAHQSAPGVPVEIMELRWRDMPTGGGMWTYDWVSVADPKNPFFRIVEAKMDGSRGEDLTQLLLGETYEGAAYPYRWTQDVEAMEIPVDVVAGQPPAPALVRPGHKKGEPFLPYSMYHAMRKECLFDPLEGIEVVEGSLDIAAAYTWLQHNIFKASWPQRYGIGVYVAGTAPKDTVAGARSEVPTDPTSLLHLEAAPGVQNPQVGQWGAGIDVESLARTVAMLDREISDFDGLNVSRLHDSANPMSAEAMSISNDGKRAAQTRYQTELLPSDLTTIEMSAAIANIMGFARDLPEGGYRLTYRLLPLSASEADSRRRNNGELIAAGRKSIVDAYMDEHPGMSRVEAVAELDRIAAENKKYGAVAGTTPAPVVIQQPSDGAKNGQG